MTIFSKTAYHSTTQKGLKEFREQTDDEVAYKGEGIMVHGWGLYLQADKELNIDNYTSALTNVYRDEIIVDGVSYKSVGYDDDDKDIEYYINGELQDEDEVYDTFNHLANIINHNGDLEEAIGSVERALNTLSETQSEYNNDSIEEYKQYLLKEKEFLSNLKGHDIEVKYNETIPPSQYTVEIPDDMVFAEESLPMSEQPDVVKKAIAHSPYPNELEYIKDYNFYDYYNELCDGYEIDPSEASAFLMNNGVDGIHYNGKYDGECWVIFNCSKLKIVSEE